MNRSSGRTLPAVLAAIAVMLTAATAWSKPHGWDHGHDPQRMADYLTKQLGLTEQQHAAVQLLLTSLFSEVTNEAGRLHTLRDTLRDQQDNFEAGAARAAADEIGQLTSRMVYRMASTRAEIYQLLNDKQRALLGEMEGQREARRARWRKRWLEAVE